MPRLLSFGLPIAVVEDQKRLQRSGGGSALVNVPMVKASGTSANSPRIKNTRDRGEDRPESGVQILVLQNLREDNMCTDSHR